MRTGLYTALSSIKNFLDILFHLSLLFVSLNHTDKVVIAVKM